MTVREVEKVEGWRTTDGEVWSTQAAAETHQTWLDLRAAILADPINGSRAAEDEVYRWIVAHKDVILRFLALRC